MRGKEKAPAGPIGFGACELSKKPNFRRYRNDFYHGLCRGSKIVTERRFSMRPQIADSKKLPPTSGGISEGGTSAISATRNELACDRSTSRCSPSLVGLNARTPLRATESGRTQRRRFTAPDSKIRKQDVPFQDSSVSRKSCFGDFTFNSILAVSSKQEAMHWAERLGLSRTTDSTAKPAISTRQTALGAGAKIGERGKNSNRKNQKRKRESDM
jgi:hypothetical protein